MRYRLDKTLPYSAATVWRALSHLRHFARQDPFHRALEFIGDRDEGFGAQFRVRHSYLPIFPFGEDEVVCTVTAWEPERRLKLSEANRRRYRNHAQEFTLEPAGPGETRVRYEISYLGIPLVLLGWRLWARWLVRRRMNEKLDDLADDCAFIARSRAAA